VGQFFLPVSLYAHTCCRRLSDLQGVMWYFKTWSASMEWKTKCVFAHLCSLCLYACAFHSSLSLLTFSALIICDKHPVRTGKGLNRIKGQGRQKVAQTVRHLQSCLCVSSGQREDRKRLDQDHGCPKPEKQCLLVRSTYVVSLRRPPMYYGKDVWATKEANFQCHMCGKMWDIMTDGQLVDRCVSPGAMPL